MPTYMTLIQYTQQGIRSIKDSPIRLDTAKTLYKSLGAEIKSFYLAMGRQDVIVVSEAPDDETATKLILTIGSGGAIRTETFRVFTEDEYRKLISELPQETILLIPKSLSVYLQLQVCQYNIKGLKVYIKQLTAGKI